MVTKATVLYDNYKIYVLYKQMEENINVLRLTDSRKKKPDIVAMEVEPWFFFLDTVNIYSFYIYILFSAFGAWIPPLNQVHS